MAIKKKFSGYVSWPKPTFSLVVRTNKNFKNNYYGALMYAHYELTSLELKKEVVKYLKVQDPKHPLLDRIKDMNEHRFATIGKYMYILNHNAELPLEIAESVIPFLEKIIDEEEKKIATAKKEADFLAEKDKAISPVAAVVDACKQVVSIQDRLREKARDVAGEVEGWVDDLYLERKTATPKTVEEFSNLFKAQELKAPHLRHVHNIFERRATEISEVLVTKDKDYIEAYSNFTKAELKKFEIFYRNLLKACDMAQEVAKVSRAPRKKKPVSQEKIVSKLKYKKEDATLGIVSLNPVQIVGSKEVWVYNTKTRKLSQYKAMDERGLGVKGASLLNFSTDSAEKTVRKPTDTLADFKKASKVKLRTFLKDLSTVDVPCNGKLNEHHVILRIDK
jgi:hypothetical protein